MSSEALRRNTPGFQKYAGDEKIVDEWCIVSARFVPHSIVSEENWRPGRAAINIDFGVEIPPDKDYVDAMNEVPAKQNVADALNYMGSLGWAVFDAYTIPFEVDGVVTVPMVHYLMARVVRP